MEKKKNSHASGSAPVQGKHVQKKKRKLSVGKKYVVYCKSHSFSPVKFGLLVAVIAALAIFSGSTVVRHITSQTTKISLENIGELATQVAYYTNVQVISNSREVFGIDVPFTQNKYVFSYDGVIKAGIDFKDVSVDTDKSARIIRVDIPEIRILSNEIDEESLEVYDETKNIFNPLKLDDVNLSLIELKEESEKKAIEEGLLENARTNAEALIRSFLSGAFDLQEYIISFQ